MDQWKTVEHLGQPREAQGYITTIEQEKINVAEADRTAKTAAARPPEGDRRGRRHPGIREGRSRVCATSPQVEGLAAYASRVADEFALAWQALEDWNHLVEPLQRSGVAGLHARAASDEAVLAKAVCESFADSAEVKCLRELTPYLKAMGQPRTAEAQSLPERSICQTVDGRLLDGEVGRWPALLYRGPTAGRPGV